MTEQTSVPDPERFEGKKTVRTPYGEFEVEYAEYLDLHRRGLILDQTKKEARRGSNGN